MGERTTDGEEIGLEEIGVGFSIIGKNVDPLQITKLTNITADDYHVKGDTDPLKTRFGGKFDPYLGYWGIGSHKKIHSTDVNEHLSYLLSILLPHRDILLTSSIDGESSFEITLFYTGDLVGNYSYITTAELDPKNILGASWLKASIVFAVWITYTNLPDSFTYKLRF